MTLQRIFLVLAVLGLGGLAVGPAAADNAKAWAQRDVRIEMRAGEPGQQPQIRMWVNGREVDPGEAIGLGEGKAWIRISPVPRVRARHKAEEREEPEEAPAERPAGFLGIMAAPLNDDMRDIAGTDEGVLINSLTDDSPAAKAGLRPGDVIVRIDDTPVDTVDELVEILRDRKAGDRVRVVYYRMRKRRETRATLGRRPEEEAEREKKEGIPLFDLPEDLFGDQAPGLREYLKRLRPELEEWARKFREQYRKRSDEWPKPGIPEVPPPPGKREPYDVGKDIGRVLERLDRIERRLDAVEKRLREMNR